MLHELLYIVFELFDRQVLLIGVAVDGILVMLLQYGRYSCIPLHFPETATYFCGYPGSCFFSPTFMLNALFSTMKISSIHISVDSYIQEPSLLKVLIIRIS